MKKTSKILIIGEIQNQHAAHVTVELLGEGRKLADSLDAELILTIVGNDVEKTCKDLLRYPADRIIAADHPSLKQKQLETHSRILYEIVKEQKPDMILGGATLFGKTLLPTLAAMLGTEVMTDAVGLEIDKETGKLLVTKPALWFRCRRFLCRWRWQSREYLKRPVRQTADKESLLRFRQTGCRR